MSAHSLPVVFAEHPTAEKIAGASCYLADTRDALVDSVAGLSTEQWNFKAAPDCWSIAEILEHVVVVERRVHAIVNKLGEAPPPPEGWDEEVVDTLVLKNIPDRSGRFQAPQAIWPTEHWTGTMALQNFLSGREKTAQLLSTAALRGHVFPHPVLGPWDGYQWLLAAGAHGLRHVEQICEVKGCSNFPVSSIAETHPQAQ